ncbi:SAM-dependent methyltransferase [Nocardia noduli]|uniref:SAM-dependent methyltransferase n=1 Tax=Nocardia noduli TaxID=2815722 RepID=UPI001C229AF0|nr:SAM-dependent methyltransferase [Nocardia noduli]
MTEPAAPLPAEWSRAASCLNCGDTGTGFDETRPATARIIHSCLGGKDAYAVDRQAAAHLEAALPGFAQLAQMNRDWVHRVVAELAAAGVHQFLDLGTGLPHPPYLHEVLGTRHSPPRVVYVDRDAMVVRHALTAYKDPGVAVIHADLTDPDVVLRLGQHHGRLDLDEPVAVVLAAVLHYIDDARVDIAALTRAYTDVLAPGSYLAISHYHRPVPGSEVDHLATAAQAALLDTLGCGWFRTYDQIHSYFAGLSLLGPGLRTLDADAHTKFRTPAGQLLLTGLAHKI